MTQVGEGRGAGYDAAPTGGEILAERYQLTHHVNTDRSGRQIWRGVDVVLRRPVAVVIRYPGGSAAEQMLQVAVGASRIVHPNLAGVYDAIDEHSRAYVVREWVEGVSLRDYVATGLFEAPHAVAVARSCAEAVTAVHASGMSHGNVHPGTVLIDADGRVVLADADPDGVSRHEEDVRAIGALLYFTLTGYWPHAEVAGPAGLPDAVRDGDGALASPRQVRAGIPAQLDHLTMDLLDRQLPVPQAEVVTGELARLDDAGDAHYAPGPAPAAGYYPPAAPAPEPEINTGPIRFRGPEEEPDARPSGRRLVLGLGGLLAAAIVGLLVGLNWLTGGAPPNNSPDPEGGGAPPSAGAPAEQPTSAPSPIALTAGQVRVVDPGGDRTELDGIEAVVDDDPGTAWRTDTYNSPGFGNLKPGMGILIDLGEPTRVSGVRVELSIAGATADLRAGDEAPDSSAAGDEQIYQSFQPVSEPQQGATTLEFALDDPEATHQYLLVWFSDLPAADGGYRVEVTQVAVEGY